MNPHLFVVFLEALKDNWKTKNYVFSNINNDKFHKCRAVLKAKTKDIESQDKGNTPHAAEAISDQVVDRLYRAKQLGADNATRLQNIYGVFLFLSLVWDQELKSRSYVGEIF